MESAILPRSFTAALEIAAPDEKSITSPLIMTVPDSSPVTGFEAVSVFLQPFNISNVIAKRDRNDFFMANAGIIN
jgi:hypothetical protein